MQDSGATWIITADGREAAAYEERVRQGRLHPLPDEAVRADNLEAAGAGRSQRATVHDRHGSGRHGVGDADPRAGLETRFFAKMADRLEAAALAGRFAHLVLMAPPRALGHLRQALGPHASARLELAEPHDRLSLSEDGLRQALQAARTRA